jgi:hypothetical protein
LSGGGLCLSVARVGWRARWVVAPVSLWTGVQAAWPAVGRGRAAFDARAPREAFAVATITSLLRDLVTLQVRSVDRIFLAGYVPRLQCEGQLIRFMLDGAGGNVRSPAILGRVGRAYVEVIDQFALGHRDPGGALRPR